MINTKRIGSYYISDDVMMGDYTEQLLEALQGVYVASAIHNLAMKRMEYVGFSEEFEVVETGRGYPHYQLMVREQGGMGYPEWTKVCIEH